MNTFNAINSLAADGQHPFEINLGKGPYKYMGCIEISKTGPSSNPDLQSKVTFGIGTCAHCGMAIMNVYVVKIGDGRMFGVGEKCIELADMDANEIRKMKADAKKIQTRKRKARATNKTTTVVEIVSSKEAELASLPHPNSYMATKGHTLLDYCKWMLENSGDAGKTKLLKLLQSHGF